MSFLPQDVTSEERWIEVVAEIGKRHGRLDIMVSNAGIGIGAPSIVEMSLADCAGRRPSTSMACSCR